ncbi:hypothetical protein NQD34_012747 [Periophthalmus magnuspinnatus]|nr:hypothetical protein NQD34_012747 [Periophthalmus magnuspinnatus]
MVWSRQHFKKKSFHSRKKTPTSSRNRATLQFWLWRKRNEAGILRRSRSHRRLLKNIRGSRQRVPFKTKRGIRITKQVPSSDVAIFEASSQTSTVMSNGTAEKKVEICKVNSSCLNHSDAHWVSSGADVSGTSNDFKKDLSECSRIVPGECLHTVELKLNSDVEVVLAEENKDVSMDTGSPHTLISKNIRKFLNDFHKKYGSFIPLQKSELLKHLKKDKSDRDFKDYEIMVLETTIEEMAKMANIVPYFEVKYKKHILTLDDLLTLASANWLNDQVINMYGELIMDWAHSEVHFLNSFFHRQLLTKGYEGVKRWTKQVDLFSKRLLLVPVHLEVHWCLVTADFVKKKVCLYDSQGIGLQEIARPILKYVLKEAKEKKQKAFEEGWTEIPQQTTENDCGVFVLEYSRCLTLSAPLQFSQGDIPKIRKRIYKEL